MSGIFDRLFGRVTKPSDHKPKVAEAKKKAPPPPKMEDRGPFEKEEADYEVHVSKAMFANVYDFIIDGHGAEVQGAIVVEPVEDGVVELAFVTYTAKGSMGGVTNDPLHDLQFTIECQEKYDKWPNGDWHSHPGSAYWSGTDEKDQAANVRFIRNSVPDGEEATYYALVAGTSLDWLVRRFRWIGGQETVYYSDVIPLLNGKTPIKLRETVTKTTYQYKTDYKPYVLPDWWSTAIDILTDGNLWSYPKMFRDEFPEVVKYWMEKQNIDREWDACVHFVAYQMDDWRNQAKWIDQMMIPQQMPLLEDTQQGEQPWN